MSKPHLFTNPQDIVAMKGYLAEYSWYRDSFTALQARCDTMLKRGFAVPKTSSFVFYTTCKRDNTNLIFDPYNPHDHVCPTCGMNYKDEPFHRAWQCYYHQWLSQMSMNLGICYAMTGDESYAAAIKTILLDYVKYYPTYPNKDNELGTTRVYQSTYMESVWLSYLCCGYDLVNSAGCFTQEDRQVICKDLFLPSAYVIYDYDERRNNRQAFNNSGLCAAGILAEDSKLFDYSLNGPHGFVYHMDSSVLSDGLWYEGDNYHFATVPSMVNIAEMCHNNGIDLYNRSFNGHTVKMMFDAPLLSLQPDFTFPSRKDSPYASLMAQKWYAGLYELAYKRYGEESYAKILKAMYAYEPPKNQSYKNAAGIMDVFEATHSSRSNLDWRGFLSVRPDLGSATGIPVTKSVNMQGTGLAVLRRNEGIDYASVDYGNYGGGHGHPDRLALTCFLNGRRWMTDYGTGQYYFDHLHWYRSTLGHNTLGIDGKNQLKAEGTCEIFAELPETSVTRCRVDDLQPGVKATRTAVLLPGGLLFDLLTTESDDEHTYESFLHSFGTLQIQDSALQPDTVENEASRFLSEVYSCKKNGGFTAVFTDEKADLIVRGADTGTCTLSTAQAYGPPTAIPKTFPIFMTKRKGNNAQFACLLEDVPKGATSSVASFTAIGNDYKIVLQDASIYTIVLENGVTITLCQNGKSETICALTPENTSVTAPVEPIIADTWFDYATRDGKPLCVKLQNMTNSAQQINAAFTSEQITLAAKEAKTFRLPLHNPCTCIKGEIWSFTCSLICGRYTTTVELKKAYIKPLHSPRVFPLDSLPFVPNLILEDESKVTRAERHWGGKSDVSVQGMATVVAGETLCLQLHITDNQVLFSGGKFPFDNDGVMVYFDRRPGEYAKVDGETQEVYGLLVRPGVFDEASSVAAIAGTIKNINEIGVSVWRTEVGYDITLDIPFTCIGGIPATGEAMGFDLIVNDRDSGVRRELQMIWSGATPNERIYLHEAHHSPLRYGIMEI